MTFLINILETEKLSPQGRKKGSLSARRRRLNTSLYIWKSCNSEMASSGGGGGGGGGGGAKCASVVLRNASGDN